MTDSTVRNYLAEMNERQAIVLTNSKVLNRDIKKLANRGEKFITESGVYKLIFKSKKKEAIAFKDWVTDEVLPQIRQTGGYIRYNKYRLLRRNIYVRKYDREITSSISIIYSWTNMLSNNTKTSSVKERGERTKRAGRHNI